MTVVLQQKFSLLAPFACASAVRELQQLEYSAPAVPKTHALFTPNVLQ